MMGEADGSISAQQGTVKADWGLRGVSCADCARKAAAEVRTLPGVDEAEIQVLSGRLVITYDPASLERDHLRRVLDREGIELREDAPSPVTTGIAPRRPALPEAQTWTSRPARRTYLAGVFFFSGLFLHLFTGDPAILSAGPWYLPLSGVFHLAAAAAGGWNFFPGGIRSLLRLRLDMQVLMSIAIVGAVALGEYVEASAIAFLFSLAELMEDFAVDRARNALRSLMAMAPEKARVQRGGEVEEVPVEEVEGGEVLLVRAGERIPLDGTVSEGRGSLDQSPVTGESMPVERSEGEEVYGGSVLSDGYLEVTASGGFETSTLQRIIRLIQEAEQQKAPAEQFVDRFARWYTPSVVGVAVLITVVPPLFFTQPFTVWFLRALILLVIACPCALVISTPVSVVSALTAGARNGVLVKGGRYMEALGTVRTMAFDKTGTLTHGRPRVVEVRGFGGSEEEALRRAAALEERSSHPLARAVVAFAGEEGRGRTPEVTEFEVLTGEGVEGRVDSTRYGVGRPECFRLEGEDRSVVESMESGGRTVILAGPPGGAPELAIALADTVRPDAREALRELRSMGIRLIMLTGDREGTARSIAAELGIDEVRSQLLPEEKVEAVRELKLDGPVAMVGDGINDAPALALADVGIAMGAAGTDTALEIADVALMADDLSRLPYAVRLSTRAVRTIRQNIGASLIIKFTLALGVFPGLVSLITAVLVGDMGASLGVTANALRLVRVRP
ncbi:MAG: cation-translocating P-type ATPase [bacterium]